MFARWFSGEARGEHVPDHWLSTAKVGGVLFCLFGVFFAPVCLGWETFTYLDSGLFAYPVAFHLKDSIWRGEFPLWNPYSNCGVPFAAQWNTLGCYPLSLFYVLLPMPWALNVFCLGHLVLGGAGMHYLAKRWTGHSLGAAFAGVVFAFNGLTWYGIMWPHIIAALGWMPWVVAALENALERGGRAMIAAAALGALQMLTGGAEAILQTWLVVGALGAWMCLRRRVAWGTAALRGLGCAVIVFCLAAIQLLPFVDLLVHSQRTAGYADATTGAMAPFGWANFILPLFHQVKNTQGIYVPAQLNWTGSYYMGVGTIALAAVGIWKACNPRVWLLLSLCAVGLLLALGSAGVVYSLLKTALPFLGMVRFPVKFVMLTTFALPLLAAFGIAQWLSSGQGADKRSLMISGGVLCGAVGVLALIAWVAPHPKEDASATLVNGITRVVMIGATVGTLLLLKARGGAPGWQVLLMLVAWMDVYTHGSNLSPTVPAGHVEPGAVRAVFGWEDALKPGGSRAMLSPSAMAKMLTAGSPDAVVDTQGRRLALYMNFNLLDKVPKVDGLWSLELRDYDVVRGAYFATVEQRGLLNFLGVTHVSSPTNAVQWVPRDGALPMILGGQKTMFASPEEATGVLMNPEFAAREVVLLGPEDREMVGERERAHVTVSQTSFSSHRIQAEFEAERDSVITIAQSYYHGWRAYVDGRQVPLLKANVGFQAVAVRAGKHLLELRYEDRMFWAGGALSVVAWAGLAFTWFRGRRKVARG